jgi:hypothetical protein
VLDAMTAHTFDSDPHISFAGTGQVGGEEDHYVFMLVNYTDIFPLPDVAGSPPLH